MRVHSAATRLTLLVVALAAVGCKSSGTAFNPPPPPLIPKFAYVANRNSANVSAYTINATTGALAPVAGSPFAAGTNPVGVAVDPTGKFAYVGNYSSNNVSAYTINATTGALTPVPGSPFAAGNGPIGVAVAR